MVGAIIGGLSAVASGISALQNFQRAKTAEKSAKMYVDTIKGNTEQNMLKGLSVPDYASLGYQQNQALMTDATRTAAQGGAESVIGSLPSMVMAGMQANAQTTQDQAGLMYNRDLAVADQAAAIEQRDRESLDKILTVQATGAATAAADARSAANKNVTDIFSGLGSAAEKIFGNESFDDWQNKRNAKLKEREANQNTPK